MRFNPASAGFFVSAQREGLPASPSGVRWRPLLHQCRNLKFCHNSKITGNLGIDSHFRAFDMN
ncbi:MAG: hypothetical protein K2P80_02690 [Beijerinckiaceae bacterium]|nr:hypothetical protein [Beijerinckiaceae bacterium]